MSADIWHIAEDSETADIRDENRLRVATAVDFDTARQIVAEHNAYDDLLAALRLCEDRLGVLIECDNEDHGGASEDDVSAWKAARAAIAKAIEVQS